MPRGGRKKGTPKTGGRKAGTPNKLTAELTAMRDQAIIQARTGKLLPLDVMMARLRQSPLPDGTEPTDQQFAAAIAAAPYVHPRLIAAQVSTPDRQRTIPPVDVSLLPKHLRRPFEEILLYAETMRAERSEPVGGNGANGSTVPMLTIDGQATDATEDNADAEATDAAEADSTSNDGGGD